jgi:hypothetical protein
MGRRRLSLAERITEGSFRPRHHSELLAENLLPAQPPEGTPRKAFGPWRELRHAQLDYQGAATPAERREAAFAFQAAAGSFVEANSSIYTTAQVLHATIGPGALPYHGLTISRHAWLDKVVRPWATWESEYGAAWRLRNSLAIEGDEEAAAVVAADDEIPDPPGLDLVGEIG